MEMVVERKIRSVIKRGRMVGERDLERESRGEFFS